MSLDPMKVSGLLAFLLCVPALLTRAQDYSGALKAPGANSTGAGLVEVSVAPSGTFTAAVHWDGLAHRRKGSLDSAGRATLALDAGLAVEFVRSPSGDAMSGHVVQRGVPYAFQLPRAAIRGIDAVPLKGNFTSFIEVPPPGPEDVSFDGDGTVAIQVAKPARVQRGRFAGRMPDGEPFTAGSKFGGGKFPVFSKLYKRNKQFLGSVASDYDYEIIGDPDFPDRFFSDVAWQKQAGTSAVYYPAAINKNILTESFKFFRDPGTKLPFFDPPAPPPGEGAELQITISGGDLPGPITKTVFYRPGKPVNIGNNSELRIKLKLDPLRGKFSGSFNYPAISTPVAREVTKTSFSGVIQLLANQGRAPFRGPTRSGRVVLRLQ
jgi:hypothetical protein